MSRAKRCTGACRDLGSSAHLTETDMETVGGLEWLEGFKFGLSRYERVALSVVSAVAIRAYRK